jgi:hypothetical protein
MGVSPVFMGEFHGIPDHRNDKGFCGVGADDFTGKPEPAKIRKHSHMIDMGMGQEKVIELRRVQGPILEGAL